MEILKKLFSADSDLWWWMAAMKYFSPPTNSILSYSPSTPWQPLSLFTSKAPLKNVVWKKIKKNFVKLIYIYLHNFQRLAWHRLVKMYWKNIKRPDLMKLRKIWKGHHMEPRKIHIILRCSHWFRWTLVLWQWYQHPYPWRDPELRYREKRRSG